MTCVGRAAAFAIACVALSSTVSWAERLPLRQYATADGLPHERVKRIVADSRGFIWFATPDGLGRFDGNRFVTWRRTDGLPHDSINDILETRDGAYWFATNGGGLARLDPPDAPRADAATPGFVTVRVGPSNASQRVNALFEDREGNLWAGSDGGLFRREPAGDASAFTPVALGIDGVDDQRLGVWTFAEDERGRLWIGTSFGIVVRDVDGRFTQVHVNAGKGRDTVWALHIDRAGRLWIGHDRALLVVSPVRADVSAIGALLTGARHRAFDAPTAALPSGDGDAVRYDLAKDGVPVQVRSILEDDDGTVWVATLGLGLLGIQQSGVRVWNDSHGLSDPRLLTLALDRAGNVWLGSLSRGAMRLANGGFTFFSEADGIIGRVARVFEDEAGSVYAATDGGRIFRMAADRPEPFGPTAAEAAPSATGDFARVPIRDRQGMWWIPTVRGLLRFGPAEGRSLRTAPPQATYTTTNGLASASPYRLYEDARGDVWFGYLPATSDLSLTRWERATGTFHHYGPREGLPAHLAPDAFVQDTSGAMWIAYYDGPVVRYRDGGFVAFSAAQGVPSTLHRWMHIDRRGRLWLSGSGSGLIRCDNSTAPTPTFRSYGLADGLGTNEVRGITDDGFGRIYVATLRGVDRLDPETDRVRRFTTADGLLGAEFEIAYRDRLSRLWFSSPEGLARLVPRADDATRAPSVLIGSLVNAGVPHPVHELGEADVEGIIVQPGQERLAISLIGLGGEGLQYQYRLDRGDWSAPANQDMVLLAGLSSGSYVFEARAVSVAGVPGERTARVHFRVLAPIWQRWWFLLAAGVAVAGLVTVLHRIRVDRLLALERVRTRIATDLHDDIGASLSQIAILSEVARQQPEDTNPEVAATLERIAATAREMVDSMSDIVWAINPRRDALSDLTHRMRRFGNDTCSAADVRFVFQAPPDGDSLRLTADLRREIYLIFKEAMNNAVRHADAEAIDASLAIERQRLVLTVRDNGRGFQPETATDGNGLGSMRRRAGARSAVGWTSRPGKNRARSSPYRRPSAVEISDAYLRRWQTGTVIANTLLATPGSLRNSGRVGGSSPPEMMMQTSPDASSAASPAIDVAVVEDMREIRQGLTALIDRTPGFRSVGAYRSMEEAIDGIDHRVPRVVLCDIGLPGMSGLEGIKILKAKHPSLQVLMLTVYDDDDRIFEALCAGATGYLLKKTPPARLIECLREAVDGGSPISPEVARRVITLFRDVRPPQRADYELTPHESRLLRMLVDGHNYKTAAVELGVSVNTIAFHMKRIYEKLQVHSKSEAVAKALRDGLVR